MKSQEYFATDVSEDPSPAFLYENRVKVGATRSLPAGIAVLVLRDNKPYVNPHYSMKLPVAVNLRVPEEQFS